MKDRRMIFTTLGVLAIASLVGAAAWAYDKTGQSDAACMEALLQGGVIEKRRLAHHMLAVMARHLELTDAQKADIRTILTDERSVIQPLVHQLLENRRSLQTVTAGGQFDETQVRAIAEKQAQVLAQLIVEKERVKSEVYQVLTPEQQARADKVRERLESRIREWFDQ